MKHCIILITSDFASIDTATYQAKLCQHFLNKKEVDKIVKAEVEEPVTTKRTLKIELAPNKGKRVRFCVSFCRLSAFTERDGYMIPGTDEGIDELGEAQVLSALET